MKQGISVLWGRVFLGMGFMVGVGFMVLIFTVMGICSVSPGRRRVGCQD